MKLKIFAIALMLASGTVATAQTVEKRQAIKERKQIQLTPEQRAANRTSKMQETLSLSEDQSVKIRELHNGIALKQDAIRNDQNLSKEQKKEALKANHDAYKIQLAQILDETQLKKYEDWEKHKMEKREAKQRAHAGKKIEAEESLESDDL